MQKSKIKIKNQKENSEIEKLKTEVADLTNKWKRALADYQNLEKKTAEQKKEWLEWANSDLILKLLPLFSNLEKTAAHLKDQGLDLSVNQFKKILNEEGVEVIPIEAGKTKFDAHLMECVETQAGQENQILKVVENGYKLKGRLLRPAKVVVGKKA